MVGEKDDCRLALAPALTDATLADATTERVLELEKVTNADAVPLTMGDGVDAADAVCAATVGVSDTRGDLDMLLDVDGDRDTRADTDPPIVGDGFESTDVTADGEKRVENVRVARPDAEMPGLTEGAIVRVTLAERVCETRDDGEPWPLAVSAMDGDADTESVTLRVLLDNCVRVDVGGDDGVLEKRLDAEKEPDGDTEGERDVRALLDDDLEIDALPDSVREPTDDFDAVLVTDGHDDILWLGESERDPRSDTELRTDAVGARAVELTVRVDVVDRETSTDCVTDTDARGDPLTDNVLPDVFVVDGETVPVVVRDDDFDALADFVVVVLALVVFDADTDAVVVLERPGVLLTLGDPLTVFDGAADVDTPTVRLTEPVRCAVRVVLADPVTVFENDGDRVVVVLADAVFVTGTVCVCAADGFGE